MISEQNSEEIEDILDNDESSDYNSDSSILDEEEKINVIKTFQKEEEKDNKEKKEKEEEKEEEKKEEQ